MITSRFRQILYLDISRSYKALFKQFCTLHIKLVIKYMPIFEIAISILTEAIKLSSAFIYRSLYYFTKTTERISCDHI